MRSIQIIIYYCTMRCTQSASNDPLRLATATMADGRTTSYLSSAEWEIVQICNYKWADGKKKLLFSTFSQNSSIERLSDIIIESLFWWATMTITWNCKHVFPSVADVWRQLIWLRPMILVEPSCLCARIYILPNELIEWRHKVCLAHCQFPCIFYKYTFVNDNECGLISFAASYIAQIQSDVCSVSLFRTG